MSVQIIKNSVFMHKASHLYYTPWIFDSTNNVWKPGDTTHDILEILADTIAIEQGDPTTETVDWEFGDTPLMSSSTKGERTVTAACVDMSFDIMQHVFGWKRQTATGGGDLMVSEQASKESYATMVITFHAAAAPFIVLPKVSMNAKTTIGTLKTSTGQAELTGTAMSAYVEYNDGTNQANATTEMAFIKPANGGTISIFNTIPSGTQTPITIAGIAQSTNGEFYLTDGTNPQPQPISGITPAPSTQYASVFQTAGSTVIAIPVS